MASISDAPGCLVARLPELSKSLQAINAQDTFQTVRARCHISKMPVLAHVSSCKRLPTVPPSLNQRFMDSFKNQKLETCCVVPSGARPRFFARPCMHSRSSEANPNETFSKVTRCRGSGPKQAIFVISIHRSIRLKFDYYKDQDVQRKA